MSFNLKNIHKNRISVSKKKEITQYVISFFFAWLVSALISDFPFFKKLFIQSINLDESLTSFMVFVTESLLNIIGFQTFSEGNFIKIIGTPGVTFSYGCLGFREFAFFLFFIIFQSGKIKNKIWYIPLGVILLITLNVIRVLIIILGQYRNPDQFQLIHDIVSPVIMYPAILFLWLFWLNISRKKAY